ncbi:hypothetical protein [Niabella soli]|uniref:Uncharacterized protein n=1 Tax=Niabella soli DSM 19437 TaxID=929713 RepID=W0F404_9BACT|nr:hypothetical protein [Niabella soli]AHF17722.1 hypothetical protein NIASO_13075 [Niabella soli DSM 19437]
MNKTQLVKKVYDYYPKGLTPAADQVGYDRAYARRKRSARIMKERLSPQWEAFMRALKERFPPHQLKDQTELYLNKFCFYLDYASNENRGLFKVHILLSVLMPWHSIVVTDFMEYNGAMLLDHDQFCLNNEAGYRRYQEEIALIDQLLKSHFKTELVLYRDLNKIMMPGAYLKTKKANVNMFDLVFANYFTNF